MLAGVVLRDWPSKLTDMEYRLKVLSMFEIGQRANQEDYMYPAPGTVNDDDRCFVLCDGMGGHDSGEVASQAVCDAMGRYVKDNCSSNAIFTGDDLRAALAAAYDALDACDTHAVKKMGTTMTFAKFHEGGCLVAHMGDSRVYHMRPSVGILFETRDHSLVNDLIKVGELTEEDARDFKQKNVITRCMQPNTEYRSRADIKEIVDIRPGDYIFMCSDGVNEVMESRHLANVILDPSYTDEEKVNIIKGNTVEAKDNHTAYLIHVLDVIGAPPVEPVVTVAPGSKFDIQEPAGAPGKKLNIRNISIVAGLLLALVAVAVFFLAGEPVDDKVSAKVTVTKSDGGKTAVVKFSITPEDAKLFVNGVEEVPNEDGCCQLEWGKHKVEVRKDGYMCALFDVDVDRDSVDVQPVILTAIDELNSQVKDDRPSGKSGPAQLEPSNKEGDAASADGSVQDGGAADTKVKSGEQKAESGDGEKGGA